MSGLTLVAVVDAAPGAEEEAIAYEDAVLALLPDHGARLVARYRRVGEGPLETHVLWFPDAEAFEAFRADRRRTALADVAARVLRPVSLSAVTPVEAPTRSR